MQSANDWPAHAIAHPSPSTLTAISESDPTQLSPAQLVDAISCSERLMSHVAGLQTTLITEFARPGRAGDITNIVEAYSDFGGPARSANGILDTELLHALVSDHAHGMAAAEIAAALHISPITARHRVEKAIDLHEGLPATHQALTEGRIDRGRAAMIAEHTAILDDPELRAVVEEKILPLAETRTAGRLRPLVDRAVIMADPDAAERRVKKARRGREVTHQPSKDDMSIIRASLPADGAVTVYTLIDLIAAATKTPGDDRGIGERRADALTDIADQLLSHGHLDLRGLLYNPEDDEDNDWSDGGTTTPSEWDAVDPDDNFDDTDRNNAWKHVDRWDANDEASSQQPAPVSSPGTDDPEPQAAPGAALADSTRDEESTSGTTAHTADPERQVARGAAPADSTSDEGSTLVTRPEDMTTPEEGGEQIADGSTLTGRLSVPDDSGLDDSGLDDSVPDASGLDDNPEEETVVAESPRNGATTRTTNRLRRPERSSSPHLRQPFHRHPSWDPHPGPCPRRTHRRQHSVGARLRRPLTVPAGC
jgi:hypothetical protein